MSEIVKKGIQLVQDWERAEAYLVDLYRQANRAECERNNARNALGKWMSPTDAAEGEKFSIWHGNRLLEVTKDGHDYKVTIRGQRSKTE